MSTIGEQLDLKYSDKKSEWYNIAHDDTRNLSEVLQIWIDQRKC